MNINVYVHLASMDEVKLILKSLANLTTIGEAMNTALQAHIVKQNAFNQAVSDGVDQANQSLTGLAADIKTLTDKIAEIQASAGELSTEDQAALDAADAAGDAAGAKLAAFTTALKALDDLTPPVADPAVVTP